MLHIVTTESDNGEHNIIRKSMSPTCQYTSIMAVKVANEFKGQRAYNSTPSTFFKVNNHT